MRRKMRLCWLGLFCFAPEVIARGTKPGRKGKAAMAWEGYTTARWRRLRSAVLRRDKYLCREALRYGRRVEATFVHHVWPAEDYPEYAWSPWNLISLSKDAHNAMHDRVTHKLSPLGESWRRRTSPPPSDP